jgi:hypothetical protein
MLLNYEVPFKLFWPLCGHLGRGINKITIVVVFLLGDFPCVRIFCADVSEHCQFHLHGWCRQDDFYLHHIHITLRPIYIFGKCSLE